MEMSLCLEPWLPQSLPASQNWCPRSIYLPRPSFPSSCMYVCMYVNIGRKCGISALSQRYVCTKGICGNFICMCWSSRPSSRYTYKIIVRPKDKYASHSHAKMIRPCVLTPDTGAHILHICKLTPDTRIYITHMQRYARVPVPSTCVYGLRTHAYFYARHIHEFMHAYMHTYIQMYIHKCIHIYHIFSACV